MSQEMLVGGALSLLAGLCTGIGAAVALFMRRTNTKMLTFALGASAGVMVYISFMELMPTAADMIEGHASAKWITISAFFGGMLMAALIDKLIPEDENPHEVHDVGVMDTIRKTGQFAGNTQVRRSAFLFALAIAIHNFPEGIATVAAAFDNMEIAASVAIMSMPAVTPYMEMWWCPQRSAMGRSSSNEM